jgi:hypothetical protein
MSLEATHIRFSLEIKDDLEVFDLEKFISGTIYPDARYVTGISRNLTHDLGFFRGRKNMSDFEKGWMGHIIGDRVFKEVMEEKFPDLTLSDDFVERWTTVTAIKIIQDITDVSSFDMQKVVDFLDYYEIHFHEDERKVIEYNNVIRNMYKGKEKICVQDCLSMWTKLGMNKKEIAGIQKRLIELYGDEKLIERINENFDDGMELYKEKYADNVKIYGASLERNEN